MNDDALRKVLSAGRLGVLATVKRDGRPQMSTVTYVYDAERDLVRVSVTDDRAKTRNLRRDPRASLHVTGSNRWTWVVAEATADISPVAEDPHDTTVEQLVDYYRTASGEHPDWDEYRQAMVNDKRVMLSLHVERLYGQVG